MTDHPVRYADVEPTPWANGRGVTRLLARGGRPGSGWRVSIAEIDRATPFSAFPGMTRILVPIRGGSLDLTVDGDDRHVGRDEAIRFDGSCDVTAESVPSRLEVLNVMFDTAELVATLTVCRGPRRSRLADEGGLAVGLGGAPRGSLLSFGDSLPCRAGEPRPSGDHAWIAFAPRALGPPAWTDSAPAGG